MLAHPGPRRSSAPQAPSGSLVCDPLIARGALQTLTSASVRGCVKTRATQLSAQQFTRIQRLNATQRKTWSRSQLQAVETCAGFSQGRVFTQPRGLADIVRMPEPSRSQATSSAAASTVPEDQTPWPSGAPSWARARLDLRKRCQSGDLLPST